MSVKFRLMPIQKRVIVSSDYEGVKLIIPHERFSQMAVTGKFTIIYETCIENFKNIYYMQGPLEI